MWGECNGDCSNKARRSICTLQPGVVSHERKTTTETRLDDTDGNCLLPKDFLITDLHCSLELHCEHCRRLVDRSPSGKVRILHAVITLLPCNCAISTLAAG